MSPNPSHGTISFALPPDLIAYIAEIDNFIAATIAPLQAADDNERFFDHRREHSRTDWDNQGLPRKEWEALISQARALADEAGFYRFCLPSEYGGQNGGNLWMAAIRMHLANSAPNLANDLQNEHSVVGNFPDVLMVRGFGSQGEFQVGFCIETCAYLRTEQKKEFIEGRLDGTRSFCFGLTEPEHGSDATHMSTNAKPTSKEGIKGWEINGAKMWITGMHTATHCLIFARTSGQPGDALGITAFFTPRDAPGLTIQSFEWTFNMPTDHASFTLTNVFVPDSSILGKLSHGLPIAQTFVHENRLRQAASSLGAAEFCIEEGIKYARKRKPFGKELARNQDITSPIVELMTQVEMLRLLILKTASEMDGLSQREIERDLGDKVSMCNYWGNRLCTQAADRAIQIHGGIGYSRHKPFEHIYRHHRRYRITEGSEEIQMRKIAAYLFGYVGPRKEELSKL
ncbi:acyl-CoA dehydrogenase-like protein [Amylocarpus encephaloides]|uniref:Acyl-CoA dehydrogenase-like protein n=1 Tax=Amylocarpus encephaloides TaxID=45428 RepID=A0A9P8C5J3_9HELO|nr:acyl-CoA dehydrogenase-like protein [Amylocarpus encephaloides]